MRSPVVGNLRLRSRRRELLNYARPFAGHPSHLLNRSLKALELALQILDGGLNPIAKRTPATRKEEIAGDGSDNRADERSCRHCRSIVHTRPPTAVEAFQNWCHCTGLRPQAPGLVQE
jgi:hypothetical protein